ncbi:MAG TPA: asparagine--tRNA ligase [Firmicutes bacterium]|uniref:Asparagine--tRNA ligase n=1 Tax=Capillibacterium thermochitinicola TaxID=2699427 RepID=A0A8J6LJC9_9FIRM|nr:asparagine--tRNA ligase [Capillibacterium thermochitinicola]MBA2133726.1 asparagine--tRNA ligase [Capillibacterium thermochitinicola]HHW11890.1 asparagine--tRNA ligase [Bacillota bacterium]
MGEVLVKQIFRDPQSYLGRPVQVSGWVRTIRVSKSFGFIELNDGSFFHNIQVVFDDKLPNFQEIAKLPIATALRIEGELVESPGAKQPWEIKADKITIEGLSASDYPLQKKRHTLEYLRTIAHLRPRSNTFSAVFRLRSLAAYAIHRFFQERNFVYVHTPIITGSDCEGAGQMFRVTTLDFDDLPRDEEGRVDFRQDFFGRETHLTVSGQLEAETFCMAFRNVYTFGPTFRAENSNTPRHAAEFWMVEPEIAFADLNDNMALAEEMLKYIINYCLEQAPEEMQFFNRFIDPDLLARLDNVVNSDFGVITYTDAIELLKKADQDFKYPVAWGADLQTEHERYLTEKVFKKPVFVIDYPKEIKAFYMRLNDDGRTVAAMDLLVPGVGEIIGGSQREERLSLLEARMRECGLDFANYWWYLELRKYGGTKHAGFGLGFERAIMYLTGMANIRDVLPFPRTVNSAEF